MGQKVRLSDLGQINLTTLSTLSTVVCANPRQGIVPLYEGRFSVSEFRNATKGPRDSLPHPAGVNTPAPCPCRLPAGQTAKNSKKNRGSEWPSWPTVVVGAKNATSGPHSGPDWPRRAILGQRNFHYRVSKSETGNRSSPRGTIFCLGA